jgi:hypothetical protein
VLDVVDDVLTFVTLILGEYNDFTCCAA